MAASSAKRRREPTKAEIAETARQERLTNELLMERLADLELALEDQNWLKVSFDSEREFSREGLRRISTLARIMYLKNPLIRRAVNVQSYYVWGQGVSITARDSEVNDVVQAFLDDPGNKRVLTGHQARTSKEVSLQTEGNIFFALFTNRITGRVMIRSFLSDEIGEIICNPEDRVEPWFYRRSWEQRTLLGDTVRKTAYYPDFRHRPAPMERARSIGGIPVEWDTPIMHVQVGGIEGMKWGVPDVYAALDWAKAYKSYLEDWASIVKALQRFAWRLTTRSGARGVAAAKTRMETTLGLANGETNPPPSTGAVFIEGEGTSLTPIGKSSANVNAEDGRMLRLMVASAVDIPDTILAGDPQQGALATAKTLDRPTELAMRDRQGLWAEVFKDILSYVVMQAVTAALPSIKGELTTRRGFPEVVLDQDRSAVVDVTFPPILEHDIQQNVDAIVTAATLDGKADAATLPKRVVTTLLLQLLGVQDADEIVHEMFPEGEQMEEPEMDAETQDIIAEVRRIIAGQGA